VGARAGSVSLPSAADATERMTAASLTRCPT